MGVRVWSTFLDTPGRVSPAMEIKFTFRVKKRIAVRSFLLFFASWVTLFCVAEDTVSIVIKKIVC